MRTRHKCSALVRMLVIWIMGAVTVDASGWGGFPSDNVTLLSQVALEDFPGQPSRGNDCWGYASLSGREYALMGLYNEVAVVEVTSPSDPVVIAEISHASSNWCDIKVYQDYAYAVNEELGGMDVIDLSQVDDGIVTLVQRFTGGGLQTSHNVAIDEDSGFLYLPGSNLNGGRLVAYDLADPANPVFAGQVSSTEGVDVHDAQIVTYTAGPYAGKQIAFAAVGGTGIDIYDVTDKNNMFRLSRTTYPNLSFAHQCWSDESRNYLYINDELNGINETVIFDISNLESPTVAGTYSSGVEAIDHNLFVHDGFIYEAEYTAGLRIFDASDPLNPVQDGWFDTYPPSDAAATFGAWSNYPFLPSGIVLISTKDVGLVVVRPGPPPIVFDYPNGLPHRAEPSGDSFLVAISGNDGEILDPSSPKLHYDDGDGFVETTMTLIEKGLYEAVFDPIECGRFVQFYVSAATLGGIRIRDPSGAPSPAFDLVAGDFVDIVLDDEMETDAGWTVGAPGDTAGSGIWARVTPNGNNVAPRSDHTPEPGTMCYVTGAEPPNSNEGDNDVDGGTTTLLTPLFDLVGAPLVTISYWRWYNNSFFQEDGDEGNSPSQDVFTVDISSDDGANWVAVESVGPSGPETSGGWFLHTFHVGNFVAPTDQVRIRYVASDFGNLSVVEAAVDDFQLAIVICGLVDCNDNGIDDEFDIANCDPEDAGCQDCNGNEVPDECEDPFPQQGSIALDSETYICGSTATITVNDCGLNIDGSEADSVMVMVQSDSEPAGESVLLTETAASSGVFEGSISLSGIDGVGILLIDDGDTISAVYVDADDGLGGMDVTVEDLAIVDCSVPAVLDLQAEVLGPYDVAVSFTTDELALATVRYGLSCNALNSQISEAQFLTSFSMLLRDLTETTTYFFAIDLEDQLGNSGTDDNDGLCYTFETAVIPNYFVEQFEDNDNDLDFRAIRFTPDGSTDVYALCTFDILELPTDPTGGTVLDIDVPEAYEAVTLPEGVTVSLYNLPYSTFYVGGHGYITFESPDDEFFDTLAHHFNLPRIAALFEILEPGDGTISWKMLADRVAVTWQVPSFFHQDNDNTFQVEMYFDGRIQLNYAVIDDDDGLAGLSAGHGVPAGFIETDLSAAASCGPQPPVATDVEVVTEVDTLVPIQLLAIDEGLPDPPGELSYIVMSLPQYGSLSDPGIGPIDAVPYTLAGDSGLVDYVPGAGFSGLDGFEYKVNDGGEAPDGGDSDIAIVSITVGLPQEIYSFDMDDDPGWATQGQWEFGQPTGGGSHDGDPTSGFSGVNVYGYNLNGDYPNTLPPTHLTTTTLDCSELVHTELRFQRWLGVDWSNQDHATISASNNGSTWVTIWDHDDSAISDTSWVAQSFDISAVADGQPNAQIRWTMGETSNFGTYPGWNIDDVEIWAVMVNLPCAEDLDGDGTVGAADLAQLLGAWGRNPGHPADLDGNGEVGPFDLALLLGGWGPCR